MTPFLLDTDAVIDVLYAIGGTVTLVRGLQAQGGTLCTCDIVITEAYSGLHPHERPRAEAFLSSLQFLPASVGAARQAGEWRYDYARQGIQLPTTDCLIAAIAAEQHATVVTGNIRHFPMPGVATLALPRPGSGSGRQ